jgi:hypothetical protein
MSELISSSVSNLSSVDRAVPASEVVEITDDDSEDDHHSARCSMGNSIIPDTSPASSSSSAATNFKNGLSSPDTVSAVTPHRSTKMDDNSSGATPDASSNTRPKGLSSLMGRLHAIDKQYGTPVPPLGEKSAGTVPAAVPPQLPQIAQPNLPNRVQAVLGVANQPAGRAEGNAVAVGANIIVGAAPPQKRRRAAEKVRIFLPMLRILKMQYRDDKLIGKYYGAYTSEAAAVRRLVTECLDLGIFAENGFEEDEDMVDSIMNYYNGVRNKGTYKRAIEAVADTYLDPRYDDGDDNIRHDLCMESFIVDFTADPEHDVVPTQTALTATAAKKRKTEIQVEVIDGMTVHVPILKIIRYRPFSKPDTRLQCFGAFASRTFAFRTFIEKLFEKGLINHNGGRMTDLMNSYLTQPNAMNSVCGDVEDALQWSQTYNTVAYEVDFKSYPLDTTADVFDDAH